VDKLVTAHVEDDQMAVDFFVAKNRSARSRATTGLIPCDFSIATIGTPSRPPPPSVQIHHGGAP
jgi:hypothetical protein